MKIIKSQIPTFIICLSLNILAIDQAVVNESVKYQKNITSKMAARLSEYLSFNKIENQSIQKEQLTIKPVGIPKTMATVGSAVITYLPYDFKWMVFSGGWYWNSTDEYSSFYNIEQKYEDYSTYKAFLAFFIYRTSTTAYDAAIVGITVANSYNAEIYENKKSTTFNDYSAYYNSYVYNSSDVSYSVDEWFFTVSNVTYKYDIFTTVDDWNTNKTFYTILQSGILLPTPILLKSIPKTQKTPFISYYQSFNGPITFIGLPTNSNLFIYNLSGKLIRNIINSNTWDGTNNNGTIVTNGFYVTNICRPDGMLNIKVLKR